MLGDCKTWDWAQSDQNVGEGAISIHIIVRAESSFDRNEFELSYWHQKQLSEDNDFRAIEYFFNQRECEIGSHSRKIS